MDRDYYGHYIFLYDPSSVYRPQRNHGDLKLKAQI